MRDQVDELISQLGTDGWGGIEGASSKLDADMTRLKAEAVREAQPVAAALATPEGRYLLHWLIRKTLLRPPSDEEVMAKTAEDYTIRAAQRRGQNQIVFMLLHALQVAAGEAAPKGGD